MSGSPSSSRQRLNPVRESSTSEDSAGILNERILVLVFQSISWDIHSICQMASVCRKLRALAKRLLWKELCVSRAPGMMAALTDGGRVGCGWYELAKLLFFCCGCSSTRHFTVTQPLVGHFVKESRFSKTSGKSFLVKRCRKDMLYVSDSCEHTTGDARDLGIYRGVFGGFRESRTRACLVELQVELEDVVRCPYCGARVWSMTTARLIPKSAERRLGAVNDGIEYFVCVNGHLHGTCWLVPLSSSSSSEDENSADERSENLN